VVLAILGQGQPGVQRDLAAATGQRLPRCTRLVPPALPRSFSMAS
jgi:hypothetical protein